MMSRVLKNPKLVQDNIEDSLELVFSVSWLRVRTDGLYTPEGGKVLLKLVSLSTTELRVKVDSTSRMEQCKPSRTRDSLAQTTISCVFVFSLDQNTDFNCSCSCSTTNTSLFSFLSDAVVECYIIRMVQIEKLRN